MLRKGSTGIKEIVRMVSECTHIYSPISPRKKHSPSLACNWYSLPSAQKSSSWFSFWFMFLIFFWLMFLNLGLTSSRKPLKTMWVNHTLFCAFSVVNLTLACLSFLKWNIYMLYTYSVVPWSLLAGQYLTQALIPSSEFLAWHGAYHVQYIYYSRVYPINVCWTWFQIFLFF